MEKPSTSSHKKTFMDRLVALNPSGGVQWAITALAGLGSGIARVASEARLEFNEKIHDHPQIKEAEGLHGKALQELNIKAATGNLPFAEYLEETQKQKTDYARQLKAYATKIGFKSEGLPGYLQGTWQRFQFMGRDTKEELAFGGVIATVIGVAGTMMFFNNLNMRHKLNELNDRLDQHQNQQSRTP